MPLSLREQLNSTEGNDHYENLLFNVGLVPLKLDCEDDLFRKDLHEEPVKNYNAVVNYDDKEIFSVVSSNYKLITNRDAFNEGKRLYGELMGIDGSDLRPFKVIASKRRTFCHIDFVHLEYDPLRFQQDTWLPFLRVTNSYNRTYQLRYRIGFVRSACANGMIFDEESIEIKRTHTQDQFNIEAKVDPEQFAEMKTDFLNKLEGLFKFNVPKKHAVKLARQVFGVHFDTEHKIEHFKQAATLKKQLFEDEIEELANNYFRELGENAYAVLSVLTHLLSHNGKKTLPQYSTRANTYYERVYKWSRSFPGEIMDSNFSWDSYLESETPVF